MSVTLSDNHAGICLLFDIGLLEQEVRYVNHSQKDLMIVIIQIAAMTKDWQYHISTKERKIPGKPTTSPNNYLYILYGLAKNCIFALSILIL